MFSLSRFKKRRGASEVVARMKQRSFKEMKRTIIQVPPVEDYRYSFFKDLHAHLDYLKGEFNGQSELLFYHAQLIVLIRREADVKENILRFEKLWQKEAPFLLEHLSLRWIISAIDTFIDHSEDQVLRSILLSALVLVNTVKAYETEENLLGLNHITPADYQYDLIKVDGQGRSVTLFDGIPAFRINYSDTLSNMRQRLNLVIAQHTLAQQIFNEVFRRIQNNDTVFHRFAVNHTKKRTQWW